jgi:ERCC4-related helicase
MNMQAVKSDTGLRAATLCGQNKTLKLVKSLHEDTWDVVVATAGAVVHMVEHKQIFLDAFSCVVLDEAHHALGAHKYSHLLKHILKMPTEIKPRVLGLTASPFRVKNLVKVKIIITM